MFIWTNVDGDFSCWECKSLISLEGAPKEVGGDFSCMGCLSLTSLKGAPKEVGREFNCSGCRSLKSLKGLPSSIGGSLYLPKIDSLFDEIGKEIISKTSVKGDPCVVPIY